MSMLALPTPEIHPAVASGGHPPTRHSEDEVRAATWNLWWRFGPWRERLAAIVAELRRVAPDICGLQEVWDEPGGDLAATLARELGYHAAFAPSPAPGKWQRRLGDATIGVGVAILSRWPIAAAEAQRLPAGDAPDEGRLALFAAIDGPAGAIPFFTAHLNSAWGQSAIRRAQAAALAAFAGERGAGAHPAILTGDFNAPPDADEVRRLVGKADPPVPGVILLDAWAYARPLEPGWTWDRRNPHVAATREPDARIDYLFVGPPGDDGRGQVLDAALFGAAPVGGVWPSDHCGVLATLRG